jgi:hypothetical protein
MEKKLPYHQEHLGCAPIMKHFAYENTLPDSAEKTAGLRKLLEAKDCLVRAAL